MKGVTAWARRLAADRCPGQLVIQITDHCNASCPQCGMNRRADFRRSRLRLDDGKRAIDAAARDGVRAVSFTGGEPMLFADDLMALIRHAGSAGIPMIRTGTNGFLFRRWEAPDFADRVHRLAERLAQTPIRNFWISIDAGTAEVHESMRGFPGVIRGIEKAVPIFHRHGIFPSANLGIHRGIAAPGLETGADAASVERAFRRGFDRFLRFVEGLGFTIANACYPMSLATGADEGLDGVYAAHSSSDIVRFSPAEKSVLFRALAASVREHRSRLRLFTPLCALHALERQLSGAEKDGHGCRGGIDFFYIAAGDGDTYPCGFRGRENLGRFWRRRGTGPEGCRACEWECFRDPSEMVAPLLDGLHRPLRLAAKIRRRPAFYRLWLEDLRYYRSCDYFDGRRPPSPSRLAHFRVRPAPAGDF